MPFIRIKKCLTCDVPHEWLFEGPTLRELRNIKAMTGMTAKQFGESGDNMDPDALAALMVVLHRRTGINLSYKDADIDFADFEMEPTETEKEAMAAMEKSANPSADDDDPKTMNGQNDAADW